MTSARKTITRLASLRSRRAAVSVDINADFAGRRPSGDARLEFAHLDRGITHLR